MLFRLSMDMQTEPIDGLPLLTLPALRDRVRDGEENLMVAVRSFKPLLLASADVLTRMREFGITEFFVHEDQNIIARFERPASSPLPERADQILQHCMQHIQDIRKQTDAIILVLAKRKDCAPHHFDRIRLERSLPLIHLHLAQIEQKMWSIRNAFEALFYNEYTHDAFREEEYYEHLDDGIEQGYTNLQETVTDIERSLP